MRGRITRLLARIVRKLLCWTLEGIEVAIDSIDATSLHMEQAGDELVPLEQVWAELDAKSERARNAAVDEHLERIEAELQAWEARMETRLIELREINARERDALARLGQLAELVRNPVVVQADDGVSSSDPDQPLSVRRSTEP